VLRQVRNRVPPTQGGSDPPEECFGQAYYNASASRTYYAVFHAAQAALKAMGITIQNWSHEGLQSAFARELIHRRKIYPARLASYLSELMLARVTSDYNAEGIGAKQAERALRKAREFIRQVNGEEPS